MAELSLYGRSRVIREATALTGGELLDQRIELAMVRDRAVTYRLGRQADEATRLLGWIDFELDQRLGEEGAFEGIRSEDDEVAVR